MRTMAVAGIAALALTAGCSVSVGGSDDISASELEADVAEILQEQVGAPEPPEVRCPGPLADEEGETIVCRLTPADADITFDVTVTAQVDGTVDLQVADDPS